MSYGIRCHKVVGPELRRVIRKQLAYAVDELEGPRSADERTVHEARRRIKKVRAALRLCRDGLGDEFRRANRRMRRASRQLGPIADGEALGRAFDALAAAHPREVPPPVVATVRQQLRTALDAIEARATGDQVLTRVTRRLRQERRQLDRWPLDGDGFDVVAPGFTRTLRRSRAAMARATAHGNSRRFHAWRRRVKDHWLQLRLMEPRCADVATTELVRIDQLDELLGQAHDFALLGAVLVKGVPVSHGEAAALLRLVHREMWRCRRTALALGAAVYAEPDAAMLARLVRAWQPTSAGKPTTAGPLTARPTHGPLPHHHVA